MQLRKNNKISQEEMAKKLKISRPSYIAIEKGEKDITISQLKKISETFDVPLSFLLDEETSLSQSQNFWKQSFKKFYTLLLKCIQYGADDDGRITKTKLAKLVYLSDFAYYYHHLVPISGMEYKRLPQGPVAIDFFDIIENDPAVDAQQKGRSILVSLVEKPEEGILNEEEEKIIQLVCQKWKNKNTQEIVDFTHHQIPWSICKERETIPYSLINNEEPENVY